MDRQTINRVWRSSIFLANSWHLNNVKMNKLLNLNVFKVSRKTNFYIWMQMFASHYFEMLKSKNIFFKSGVNVPKSAISPAPAVDHTLVTAP